MPDFFNSKKLIDNPENPSRVLTLKGTSPQPRAYAGGFPLGLGRARGEIFGGYLNL